MGRAGLIDVAIVLSGVKRFKGDVGKAVRNELESIGTELTGAFAAAAPSDTGRLARSMRKRLYKRGPVYFLIAGPSRRARGSKGRKVSRYAHFAEYRTPYMRPAWDAMRPTIPGRLAAAVKRVLP